MALSDIHHFFVLMLENRSFDHMLGYMPDVGGLEGTEINYPDGVLPSSSNGGVEVSDSAEDKVDVDLGHEFDHVRVQLMGRNPQGQLRDYTTDPVTMAGFVQGHMEQIVGNPNAHRGLPMRCFNRHSLPVLSSLAAQYAVCDRWFSSVPGSTWPNRFFAHAGTSGGLFDGPRTGRMMESIVNGYAFNGGTIFDQLGPQAQIYSGTLFPQSLSLARQYPYHIRGLRAFERHIRNPDFDKQYVFIEPSYGLVFQDFIFGSSQHPKDGVASGERLIKWVYEKLRASPIWERSALIVTYDEHGGFYDHVPPPRCVAPGDPPLYAHENLVRDPRSFDFQQLGVRVPAVVASPYTARGKVDSTIYDHTSILATLHDRFELSNLTERDKQANVLEDVFDLAEPRPDRDMPRRLPRPAAVERPSRPPPAPSRERPLTWIENAFLDLVKRADILLESPMEWTRLEKEWEDIQTPMQAERYRRKVARKVARAMAEVPLDQR